MSRLLKPSSVDSVSSVSAELTKPKRPSVTGPPEPVAIRAYQVHSSLASQFNATSQLMKSSLTEIDAGVTNPPANAGPTERSFSSSVHLAPTVNAQASLKAYSPCPKNAMDSV